MNTVSDKLGFLAVIGCLLLVVGLGLFVLYEGLQTLRGRSKVDYLSRGRRLRYGSLQMCCGVILCMGAAMFVLPHALLLSYTFVFETAVGIVLLLTCFCIDSPKNWYDRFAWVFMLIAGVGLICFGLYRLIL